MNEPSTVAATSDRGARAFVWGTWAAMSIAALAYAVRFSSDMPAWDEETYVRVVAGGRPASPAWFFEPHVDHLMPLPKAVWLALFTATRDFRAGTWATCAALAAATALVLVAVRRLRGRWSFADAVIPLATLHWGQAGNLLFGFQIHVALHVLFVAGALVAMLAGDGLPTRRRALVFVACLVGMQFCGGHGAIVAPVLALWLFAAARRPGVPRADAVAFRILGLVPIALTATFAVMHGAGASARPSAAQFVATTLQALGMAAGPIGGMGWRGAGFREELPPLASIVVAVGVAATVVLLLRTVLRTPSLVATALLLHVTAIVALAAGIGFSRGAAEEAAGVQNRYVTAFVPLVWAGYVAWTRFAPPRASRVVGASALVGFAALAAFDVRVGLVHGRARRDHMDEAVAAIRSGEPRAAVADRFVPFLHPDRAVLIGELEALERAGLGPFRR